MGHARSLDAGRIPAPMLDWVRAWLRDTDTMRNEAAMIVACGTRAGFDPRLEQDAHALGAVDVPCRVLIGTDDVVGGEPVARELVAALPRADVDVMPGAGHLPWLDDPALAARSIGRFVAGSALHG
jgi:pimeloyl-ACP methyl ester carboxylesterase